MNPQEQEVFLLGLPTLGGNFLSDQDALVPRES